MFGILLGIVRQKVIALLLGATGLGLISTFQSIIDLIRSMSTLGIDTAGVKEIAQHVDNKEKQYYTISVFKWWLRLTSSFGALLCIVFCYPISVLAFKSGDYAFHIAALFICVFITSYSGGQMVVLQATRNISLMAKTSVLGNALGLVCSIILYFLFGINGIVPAFILGSIALFIFSNYFLKKIHIPQVSLDHKDAFRYGLVILKLGFFIVSVSIMETGSNLLIKAFLLRSMGEQAGLIAIGMLQPAWAITLMYLSLVLKSMGTDFFPRLCNVSNSNSRIRRLVNEQLHVALLVAIPSVVTTIVFAPYVLELLYSSEFVSGTSLLRWHVLGSFFKIISWPIAFVLLAKSKGGYFFFTEIVYFAVYLGVSYFVFPYLGIVSIGVAYVLAYIFYLIVIYYYLANSSNFRWYSVNIKTFLIGCLFIGFTIMLLFFTTSYVQLLAGICLCILSFAYSVYAFNKIFDVKEFLNKITQKVRHKK